MKERGRVTDAIVRCINFDIRVRASRGVVLATGSFARNALLERTSVVHTSITLPPRCNGNGVELASTLGCHRQRCRIRLLNLSFNPETRQRHKSCHTRLSARKLRHVLGGRHTCRRGSRHAQPGIRRQ
ncbi:FAD-binding protein [Bradyrhizobium sp. CCBAU 65884]|uniref:FAD-binding protein n=1 Tax=Bradyrhizobium sp. CCBAU 65884 TaxID=722477 RepID=UPI003FA4D296